jgi:hypothetical protein
VRPLVVEDEAVPAAQRLALEVPAVEVQGVPVYEDQGRTVPSFVTADVSRGCFVDLDGEPYAVIRDDVAALAAQRPQLGTQPCMPPRREPALGQDGRSGPGRRDAEDTSGETRIATYSRGRGHVPPPR